MAPAVVIDTSDDFQVPNATSRPAARTLLLAPPSVSSHPEALANVAAAYDRNATDIQMLDRLAMGLVALPAATYDVVLVLTDIAGANAAQEAHRLLTRDVMARIFAALHVGGSLQAQDGSLASLQTEAILAGLVQGAPGQGMVKPNVAASQTVSLNFGRKKKANAAAIPANSIEAASAAKRKSEDISTGSGSLAQANGNGIVKTTPAGVGFIDTADDLDAAYDEDEDDDMDIPSNDELAQAGQIDPNTLLTDEDLQKPIIIPEACKPNSKRRRACKDCTCGLAQKLEAEDRSRRAEADAGLAKLSATDLDEVDFTVQGKVGSCGNCALGDAFRCDGCPYIGLPAFKPGEEVRLLNNEVQL